MQQFSTRLATDEFSRVCESLLRKYILFRGSGTEFHSPDVDVVAAVKGANEGTLQIYDVNETISIKSDSNRQANRADG